MKKILLALTALSLLPFVSCEKEVDNTLEEKPVETITGEVMTIEARMAKESTKTSYTADGKFTWVSTDQIVVIAHVDGNTNNQKNFTFTTSAGNITEEGRAATFTGTVTDGYTVDYAAYPTSLASDNTSSGYSAPFVKVPSSVSGLVSSAMLIGIGDGAGGYTFNTAMSLFKINVSGVPASAAELRLVTSDKTNYPLDGDFTLEESAGVVTLDFAHYHSEWSTYDKGYQTIDISAEGAIDGRDFYFNVPIGTYPARTLSIQVLDGSGNVMGEKVITKALTTNRNELLTLPALTLDCWETLGTGRFIDNFLWAKIVAKGSVDKNVPSYVNVTIQQNISDNKKFRLVDPYGAAATQFGYTSSNAANRDDYLEFSVAGFTTASAVTAYATHRTGFAIDAYNYNPELVYPTTYNAESSTAQNLVILGDESLPKIVQLAPAYHYNGQAMTSSYTYPQAFDKKGVFRIIFPGVSNYGGSLSLASGCTARLNALSWSNESNSPRIRMVVSEYTDYEIAAPSINTYYIGNYPGAKDAASSSGTWSGTSLTNTTVNGSTIPSGVVYLTWYTVDSSSENYVYDQGRTAVYYINSSDVTTLCKQHTSTGYKGSSTENDALTGSYTFEVSEDPANSNIKMTEFDGMTADVTGMDLASTHQIYSSLYWIAPGTTTYTGADPVFTNGTAQYGVFSSSSSSILLDATKPFFKRGSVNVYVYSYTDYAGGGRGEANTPNRFKFTVAEGKVNVGETYINARFDGNNQASAPYSNTVTETTD